MSGVGLPKSQLPLTTVVLPLTTKRTAAVPYSSLRRYGAPELGYALWEGILPDDPLFASRLITHARHIVLYATINISLGPDFNGLVNGCLCKGIAIESERWFLMYLHQDYWRLQRLPLQSIAIESGRWFLTTLYRKHCRFQRLSLQKYRGWVETLILNVLPLQTSMALFAKVSRLIWDPDF